MSLLAPVYIIDYGTVTLRLPHVTIRGRLVFDHLSQTLIFTDGSGTRPLSTNLMVYGLIPEPDCCYIKDWTEHSGLTDALVDAGIVTWLDVVHVGPFRSRAYLVRPLEPRR